MGEVQARKQTWFMHLAARSLEKTTLICGENCLWGQGLTWELPRSAVCQLTHGVIKMCASHHVTEQTGMLDYSEIVYTLNFMEGRGTDKK